MRKLLPTSVTATGVIAAESPIVGDDVRWQALRSTKHVRVLSGSLHVALLIAVAATVVSAQIDRARDAPYADFIRYHNDLVRYAEQKDRDGALKASDDLRKALGAMFSFSQDVPRHLNNGNLRELGSQAQSFVDAMKDYSQKLERLQDRLKRTGEDYSSELSSLKSSSEAVKEKFNVIWANLVAAGKAVKAACMSGCIP